MIFAMWLEKSVRSQCGWSGEPCVALLHGGVHAVPEADAHSASLGGTEGVSAKLCFVCSTHIFRSPCAPVTMKNDGGKALQNI